MAFSSPGKPCPVLLASPCVSGYQVFQFPSHVSGPPLDSNQILSISFILSSLKMHIIFQIWPQECRIEGNNHFLGYTGTAHNVLSLYHCKSALLTHDHLSLRFGIISACVHFSRQDTFIDSFNEEKLRAQSSSRCTHPPLVPCSNNNIEVSWMYVIHSIRKYMSLILIEESFTSDMSGAYYTIITTLFFIMPLQFSEKTTIQARSI